ncbi:MAG: chromate transporter, partial [Clostridiaceae bacterium]|nr:chromate transporter [Clostridiaceae bacterium]
ALQHVIKNQYVQAVLRGLKPCIIGIILATGIYMALKSIGVVSQTIDLNAVIIAAVLVGTLLITKRLRKKQLSPISMIILSAALGIILYD